MTQSFQPLIRAIRDQTSQLPSDLVYVIDIVSIRFGGYFTPQISRELQKYRNLQMLTLNDCGIVSLENFPYLPNLIRIDMVFNEIKGEDLQYLKGCRHVQTLMLGANKIENISDLERLKNMNNLMQLDLINNPVYRLPGYRQKMFQLFPSLIVLDTLDRAGKDAYNNVSMMQTVHRIPEHLFIQGQQQNLRSFIPVHRQQKTQLSRALSRIGSLDSNNEVMLRKQKKTKNLQQKHKRSQQNKKSPQSNQLFPIFKIRRMIRQMNINGLKISKSSVIYLASVLQYLTAQFLNRAGQQAKNQRRHRITPLILKDCLKQDEQLANMLKSATFGIMGEQ